MDSYYFESFEYDNSVLYRINADGNTELVESSYQNHRGLCSAEGELEIPVIDGIAVLPDQIDGHPLVRIWENALENISCNLLKIPDSVVKISAEAFLCYYGSFQYDRDEQCRCDIGRISVSADHPYFEVIDGVLFHRERKELLFFPSDRKGHYAIPEGTQRIAPFSFCSSSLSHVTLPETLLAIGEYAFLDCQNLENIEGLRACVQCHSSAFRTAFNRKLTPEITQTP